MLISSAEVIYNLLVFGVVVACWVHLARRRTRRAWLAGSVWVGVAAAVLSPFIGYAVILFLIIRLWCWGLFLHGAAFQLGAAWLMRRTAPGWAWTAVAAVIAIEAAAVDAFLIEPHWLEITRVRIESPKLRRPIHVALVADLQTDVLGDYERRVLEAVAREKPDLVLFAGDYLQPERVYAPNGDCWPNAEIWSVLAKQLNAELLRLDLRPPLGIYAIGGNVDLPEWPRIFDGMGNVQAAAATRQFEVDDQLTLTCLSLGDSNDGGIAIPPAPDGRFHIVLGHIPNFTMSRFDADLCLAGHVHGGQIRLPLLGPVITLSRVPRRLATGLVDRPNGGEMMVSRGIGMERNEAPRLRFLCRPELVFFELVPVK